jgi:hypothetical protein
LYFVAIFLKKEKSYKNMLTIRIGYYIINLASRLERVKNLDNAQHAACAVGVVSHARDLFRTRKRFLGVI